MNIFNLFGQSKPKNDPYWEYNKEKHYIAKVNKGDFFKLTGFDFGWFMLEPITDFIQDNEHEIENGKSLSYGQKALYYWWYVDAQVKNGGFTQFYYNEYGQYAPTIIKALKHIGDNNMAELVNRSYELYLKENKTIKKAQTEGLEGLSGLYKQIEDFDELDDEYYKLDEKTMKIIENFIRKNPNEFCVDENGKEFDLKFSGEQKTYYSGNKIKELLILENGIINGEFKSYYENGKPKEEIQYLKGEQTGERNEYFENGNKKYSVKKDVELKQFVHLFYHENGKNKKLEHKLIENDKRIGEYKKWYENGQLSEMGTYISEMQRNGEWLEFYKDGSKKIEAEFKNGDFLIHNCWNEKGEQILKSGTGVYIYEYSVFEGLIEKNEQEYKNYKRDGKQSTYSNGILTLYQEMFEGKQHGLTKSYDGDGKLEEEIIYEHGEEKSRTVH